MKLIFEYSYGLFLCVVIGGVALVLSTYIPLGAVAIAIVLGIFLGNILKLNKAFDSGISFSEKYVLSLAIALMGVNLNFSVLKELGTKTILLVVGAMIVTIMSSIVISKILKYNFKLALLLGIGNGVCGSSAIAATEKVIGVDKEEVGLSVAIVNFLGTIGIFLLPFIANIILNFTDIKSGILIGNTLQAVGQVVAAGFSVSKEAGHVATIVKMTRILMLFPLVFILILSFKQRTNTKERTFKLPKIPIFIIGFVLFSFVPTFGLLSDSVIEVVRKTSHFALIIAMAAIGLRITFNSILKNGKMALVIGGLIFIVQIVFSGTLIYFLY